jgi:phytanoyl-CoA hydroxylase
MSTIAKGLDTQQLDFFRRHGYVAVERFFSGRDLEALQAEVKRLQREGLLRNVATDGNGTTLSQSQRNLQLCPCVQHSKLIRALPFHESLLSAISQLIGDPLVLQLDQIFLKPGGDGMGTNWHQDNAYFKISDPTMGVAAWISIHDATIANGTLHVVPESFTTALPHERDPGSDHHICCRVDQSQAVAMEVPAGSVVFFYFGTPHATRGNNTDQDRAALALHFVRYEYATPDVLEPNRSYHPILTGTNASGGLAEYGQRVGGTWEAEVSKLLD